MAVLSGITTWFRARDGVSPGCEFMRLRGRHLTPVPRVYVGGNLFERLSQEYFAGSWPAGFDLHPRLPGGASSHLPVSLARGLEDPRCRCPGRPDRSCCCPGTDAGERCSSWVPQAKPPVWRAAALPGPGLRRAEPTCLGSPSLPLTDGETEAQLEDSQTARGRGGSASQTLCQPQLGVRKAPGRLLFSRLVLNSPARFVRPPVCSGYLQ